MTKETLSQKLGIEITTHNTSKFAHLITDTIVGYVQFLPYHIQNLVSQENILITNFSKENYKKKPSRSHTAAQTFVFSHETERHQEKQRYLQKRWVSTLKLTIFVSHVTCQMIHSTNNVSMQAMQWRHSATARKSLWNLSTMYTSPGKNYLFKKVNMYSCQNSIIRLYFFNLNIVDVWALSHQTHVIIL